MEDKKTKNVNAQKGSAHKEWIKARLSDKNDALSLIVAELGKIKDPDDMLALQPGYDQSTGTMAEVVVMALKGKEEKEIGVSVKSCTGFGSSNQAARMWTEDLLTKAEASGFQGVAFRMMMGMLSASDKDKNIPMSPGMLLTGQASKKTAQELGKSMKMWLADPAVLNRMCMKAFGADSSTPRGEKLLMVSYRGAGEDGEDIHLTVDRRDLADFVVKKAVTQAKGLAPAHVRISAEDTAICLGPVLALKRKGGDSGKAEANQAQFAINTRELLSSVLLGDIPGKIISEEQTPESSAIAQMGGAEPKEDEEAGRSTKRLMERVSEHISKENRKMSGGMGLKP